MYQSRALLPTGTLLCVISEPRRMEGLLVIDQSQVQLVRRDSECGHRSTTATHSGQACASCQKSVWIHFRALLTSGLLPIRRTVRNSPSAAHLYGA
jgi:hypothetical protein